jgi:hypothetical protein
MTGRLEMTVPQMPGMPAPRQSFLSHRGTSRANSAGEIRLELVASGGSETAPKRPRNVRALYARRGAPHEQGLSGGICDVSGLAIRRRRAV